MNRVNLVLLWHMHQPLYRQADTGRYILPWTRLHALKDYWGMVRIFEDFPDVHATFNVVPSLALQIEEYASGQFDEPWFRLAFSPAQKLTAEQKSEILEQAFQVNHENLLPRWPRFVELFHQVQKEGRPAAVARSSVRDWRDLQLLSQLAWMDEIYLAQDPIVSALSRKGAGFTEEDKKALRNKQAELLASVLPEYRRAAERGQIELSTTPFFHPILPLVIDTDIASAANPHTPLLRPPFQHPDDARVQLQRAREAHARHFGHPPSGLWPSEGSVSDAACEMAAEIGFSWFASDEGVLGRTFGIGFARDHSGIPENAHRLYAPVRLRRGNCQIVGLFRDHFLSDLIGFAYGRMDAASAAADLHGRLRTIGQRIEAPNPLTVSLILDGENAWEYYRGNGREFLRQFYGKIQNDPDIRALTVSEAIAAAQAIPEVDHIAPASWINANFDVWIGHREDVRAWELLRDARDVYAQAGSHGQAGSTPAVSAEQMARAYEAVLAAEGSDWCWWYGPEHSSHNDPEFDELYRRHLAAIYLALGAEVPESLSQPVKRKPERAVVVPPSSFLSVRVDGRVTNYFEWMGAGFYLPDSRSTAMHGRRSYLRELHYGFDAAHLYLRIDPSPEVLTLRGDWELRVHVLAAGEFRISASIHDGKLAESVVERSDNAPAEGAASKREASFVNDDVRAAYDRIFELSIARKIVPVQGQGSIGLRVAFWQGGVPMDVLPAEGWLELKLGEEDFGW